MCGILGFVAEDEELSLAELTEMAATIAHRGPDGEGIRQFSTSTANAALGHRRLSIIDLARGGQPLANEDQSVWISYNGEIYNHRHLRSELLALGHRFATDSDTEVIVHAYEQWGEDCVHRLRGMFAFAIWDGRRRQLFAARDRMGIKPFYYARFGNGLIFGSEIKAILASGRIPRRMAEEHLPEQMTLGYLTGDKTLFEGIRKMPPGCRMTWKDGRFQISEYWRLPVANRASQADDEEYVEEFRRLFSESVRIRLMADVPLGVFLSGGLDSSYIAASMASQISGQLKSFSVGFESQYYSELGYARTVAKHLGTDHHEVVLRPDQFFAYLPRMIWHEDEPVRSAPSIALYAVSALAREHVKVVLTGEGSDELFAGYDRYWATLFNMRWGGLYQRMLPAVVRDRMIRQTFWKWPLPLSVKKKISHTFVNHAIRPEELVFDNFYAIFPRRVHEALFTPEFHQRVRHVDPYAESVRLFNGCPSSDPLDKMLSTDQRTYLVELLMKQDNMSMAASIESRVPFLDHHLVEFASTVPNHLKLRGTQGKQLVKMAAAKDLPAEILNRKKTGFPVPFKDWLARGCHSIVRDVLCSERTRARGVINMAFVEQMLAEQLAGRRDHTEPLWTVMNLELWSRIFLDGDEPGAMSEETSAAVAV